MRKYKIIISICIVAERRHIWLTTVRKESLTMRKGLEAVNRCDEVGLLLIGQGSPFLAYIRLFASLAR